MAFGATAALDGGVVGNGRRQNRLGSGLSRDTSHRDGHEVVQATRRLCVPFSVIMARGPDRAISLTYAQIKSVIHTTWHDHTSANNVQLRAGPPF